MPVKVSTDRLRSLFRPRNIALVGASDKSMFSANAYQNLVNFGYGNNTFLVNTRGQKVHGRDTFISCTAIDADLDLAFLMVPQAGTLDAMSDAAAAGIRNAVILSSGYAEAGEKGRVAERALLEHAESLDMLILGPNHVGFANLIDRIPVTPVPALPQTSGRVALLSQSGASASAMVDFAMIANAGLSYLITLGNEAMITTGHVLDYLVDDECTAAVAIFLEAIREPAVFAAAARRAAAAGKAIIALKAGSSALSARTAAAHTGALVGDDRTVDAVFGELGIIRVDSVEDMLVTAGVAAKIGRLSAPGIGVVSISGGACDIIADRAEDVGAVLPKLSPETVASLATIMPGYGTVQNPLDVTGAAIIDPSIFTRAVEAMSRDDQIGVVAVVNTIPWQASDSEFTTQPMLNAVGAAKADKPVVAVNQVMQPITDITRSAMAEAGLTVAICGLRQAVIALQKIAWWSCVAPKPAEISVVHPPVGMTLCSSRVGSWSEAKARQLLADNGVPVVPAELATSADHAVEAARKFNCPVAVKIVSEDILHKSDVGGVRLGVSGDGAVVDAYAAVMDAALAHSPESDIEGVLISPMRPLGVELLVGVVRDPQWGPILAIAVGGIFVEVLNDSVLATLPVTVPYVSAMLSRLKGAAVLSGLRGSPVADLDAVSGVVARIANLAYSLGDELESLEVNPLRIVGDTIEALDVVVTWVPKAAATIVE